MYKDHIEMYGESISALQKGGLLLLDSEFPEKHPEAILNLDKGTIKDLTYNLGKELEARGFATVDNLSIFLTPEGYEEARRLIKPKRHFMKTHWKWLVGAIFTLITILIAVIRLTQC